MIYDRYLLGIAFAPGRNRTQQHSQQTGFQFTVEGLTANTTYEYEFVAHGASDEIIETLSGEFTTIGESPTDIENLPTYTTPQKIIRDNQVYILNGEKIYTVTGQKAK